MKGGESPAAGLRPRHAGVCIPQRSTAWDGTGRDGTGLDGTGRDAAPYKGLQGQRQGMPATTKHRCLPFHQIKKAGLKEIASRRGTLAKKAFLSAAEP